MDELSLIESRLAATEKHVADATKLVSLQRDIVVKLESDGRDATTARKLLVTFGRSLALQIAERDRLIRQTKSIANKT
ncbi:hypothetical protein SAMCCGM7_pA0340 (plasmid) [Sinorhizobium americanum CCGM7]|nr:hypothetical protein SAMCCGM7_pA0340 [Sinorhizobium americanum CCGM7]